MNLTDGMALDVSDSEREERLEASAILEIQAKLTDFMRDLEEGYPEHFS
jgi:hypothetical protein